MNTVLVACLCILSVLTFTKALTAPEITLTITAEKRLLQAVWYNTNWASGDQIVIKDGNGKTLAQITPKSSNGWERTGFTFDYSVSKGVQKNTDCYGYWVDYITANKQVTATGCLRAHPTWMNQLRPEIESSRMADLFIPGTHDSGSYKPNFKLSRWETLFTKYSLAQDEDIKGQLMHGVRYLDIRPSFFGIFPKKPFYVNHGGTVQRPMSEVIEHVRNFVRETKEFVIIGFKEFPWGFINDSVHKKFVSYLQKELAGLIIDPALTWNVTLGELWKRNQYIFLAYDRPKIVEKFKSTLFPAVNQNWGNKDKYPALETYLRDIYKTPRNISIPDVDMAELTPGTKGTIFNKYGGLRRMADNVNSGISNLYRNELGTKANIVAVDFLRGTTIADLAIKINKNKIKKP